MKKLRQKNIIKETKLSNVVNDFTVGEDYILDKELIKYDIQGSKIHAKMLNKIGILSEDELIELLKGLGEIEELVKQDSFEINIDQEDCHTVIEHYLINKYGDVGKKIHTGRSRNDQVLVAIRLYMKDQLMDIILFIKSLIKIFQYKSEQFESIIMPGYTHMQKAMPTTVGMRFGSFASSLYDDLLFLETAQKVIDQNPLGSAAGFGESTLGIDREMTTKLLGFKKTQENFLYCAYSRGKFELLLLKSLNLLMIDIAKFANDVMIFTTNEFNFFDISNTFKTGSSIMPQKHNRDVVELLRGRANAFSHFYIEVKQITQGLLSGYNRDFQLTKEPLIKGIKEFKKVMKMTKLIVENIKPNIKSLNKACSSELYATDDVYKLVKKGIPFRDAYQQIGQKYI